MIDDIQIVIYRNRHTGKITNWHEMRASITQEKVDLYNSDDYETTAEIVTLEKGSIAHYFFTMKVASIKDFKTEFENIYEILCYISNKVDNKLVALNELVKREEETK